ncbi:MAG TPA: hypothetical protein VHC86_03960 [Opitutaceae bacterium]|nr:hypothetical protein [Opitutaceae bacterium]
MLNRLPTVGAALFLLAGGASCGAEPSALAPGEWRRALASEYRYSPPPAAAQAVPAGSAPKPAPGTVLLPAVVVEDRDPTSSRLEAHLQAAHQARLVEDRVRMLGIGYHSIGTKHFRVGYVSVFHVPVMLLGSVSW